MLNLDNFCHLSTRGACKNSNLIAKKQEAQAGRKKRTVSAYIHSKKERNRQYFRSCAF